MLTLLPLRSSMKYRELRGRLQDGDGHQPRLQNLRTQDTVRVEKATAFTQHAQGPGSIPRALKGSVEWKNR